MCKSCNIEKVTDFTHFEQKNTHISKCKIVHKCTRAIVNVQICTVTIALACNILIISNSLLFFSLFSICKTNAFSPSSCSFFLWYTHSHKHKINYKNKKSTTKSTTWTKSLDRWLVIMGHGLKRWFGSVIGNRWINDVGFDQCFCGLMWSWCGFWWLIGDVGFDQWCGFWWWCWFDRERKKKKEEEEKERGNGRERIRKKKEEKEYKKEMGDKIILKKNIKILFI